MLGGIEEELLAFEAAGEEAGEAVEEAIGIAGVLLEAFAQGFRAEINEGFGDDGDGHFGADLVVMGAGVLGGDALEQFVAQAAVAEAVLFAEVFSEAPVGLPVGDVVDADGGSVFAEAGFDLFVGDAIKDHLAELIAEVFGEAGDVAGVTVLAVGGGGG